MSSNKTANLNLHSWEGVDPFTREEFNENFAALDANAGRTWAQLEAVEAATPRVYTGSYTGTGYSGPNYPNRLSFPRPVKLLVIIPCNKPDTTGLTQLILAPPAAHTTAIQAGNNYNYCTIEVTWSDSDRSVSWYHGTGVEPIYGVRQCNEADVAYQYIAIC